MEFSYSSAASSLVGSLRRASAKISGSKSTLPALHPEEDSDAEESDSESRSSLGSDGTGTASASASTHNPASAPRYTFGEDIRRSPEAGSISPPIRKPNKSYDSGIYSGSFSSYRTTSIGDY